ncbi:hypothetical protein BKA67DRAFT_101312 [Truncatella angustata]|uniref:Uncharacterized protein n=1 Tax=Truncatella angustata TaxID=152316 RepID=A0A9P8RNC7_9PEZI|nr:uncharacterized protein BKA67DRAFT_101312 [Truncatella angustata]KAH6646390.1 hypothetical protein BKA67DRAFT_101312 [Truncatella angustata]
MPCAVKQCIGQTIPRSTLNRSLVFQSLNGYSPPSLNRPPQLHASKTKENMIFRVVTDFSSVNQVPDFSAAGATFPGWFVISVAREKVTEEWHRVMEWYRVVLHRVCVFVEHVPDVRQLEFRRTAVLGRDRYGHGTWLARFHNGPGVLRKELLGINWRLFLIHLWLRRNSCR